MNIRKLLDIKIQDYVKGGKKHSTMWDCEALPVSDGVFMCEIFNTEYSSWDCFTGVLLGTDIFIPVGTELEKRDDSVIFSFIFPDMSEYINSDKPVLWRFRIAALVNGELQMFRLKEKGVGTYEQKDLIFNRSESFREQVQEAEYKGSKFVFLLYINKKGIWTIFQCKEELRYRQQFNAEIISFSFKKGILRTTMRTSGNDVDWKSLCIGRRNKLHARQKDYFFPVLQIERSGNITTLHFEADLNGIHFLPLLWDLRPVFEKDGKEYTINTVCDADRFTHEFSKLFQNNKLALDDNLILFPYITAKNAIAFMCRKESKYDGFSTRAKERAAFFLYRLNKRKLDGENSIILFEKNCQYTCDNGYYLFKYFMDHDTETSSGRKIYFVIDKSSSYYERVKQYGSHILPFMSIRFMVHMLSAHILVSSEGRMHSYVWRARPNRIVPEICKKKAVFLQHGVIAFKRIDNFFKKSPSNRDSCDLFIVSSEDEKNIVRKYFGYDESEIAITGMARWDVLKDRSQGKRMILMMPSWRNWLDSATMKTFKESEYYRTYLELLNSPQLINLLEEKDVELNFFIHPKFREYLSAFTSKSDRIRIVSPDDKPLNDLLMECRLLVTDYSSVAWDVYYQKKPVIFFHFDLDRYFESSGSYVDFDKDLFGPRAFNGSELLSLIKESIDKEFRLEPEYEKSLWRHFKYMDDQNCSRIAALITEKDW